LDYLRDRQTDRQTDRYTDGPIEPKHDALQNNTHPLVVLGRVTRLLVQYR